MSTMTTSKWARSFVIASLGLVSFTKPGDAFSAPPAPTVKQITPAPQKPNPSPFFEFLKQQAKKNGTVYLVEGEPAQQTVETGAGGADANSGSLQEVAVRYGYQAETLPSGIIVFHKTYYGEAGLPSVTLDEWLAAVKDMKAIINAVSPHIPPLNNTTYPVSEGIKSTFTPAQFAAMQRGMAEVEAQAKNVTPMPPQVADENGLLVANLSGAQKKEVWRVARYFYLQAPLQNAQDNLIYSEALAKAGAVSFASRNGVFGFEVNLGEAVQGEARFVSLSNPYQITSTLQGQAVTRKEGATFIVPANDPTTPLPIKSSGPPLFITLKRLGQIMQNNSAAGQQIVVSDALAAKRVSVAGDISKPSVVDVFKAVAALYGLRVVQTTKQIALLRPRARITDDPAQLLRALEEMMPRPFLNAFDRTIRPDDPALRKVDLPNGTVFETNVAVAGLKWAAVRRLRQTLEAKINRAPTKSVPLAECDEDEKEAFATVLMAFSLDDLANFIKRPAPAYITQFDQTVLIGGISQGTDGRRWLSFFMGRRMPDGTLAQGGDGFAAPLKAQP